MKKNDCPIARDLMPLVLDRVASRESRQLVEDHVAGCMECKKQYEEMKADMPDGVRVAYEQEQRAFVKAMQTLRRTQLKRRLAALALVLVVCAAATLGGLLAYDRLFIRMSVPVDTDLYALSLAQLQDGRIVVTADVSKIDFSAMVASELRQKDGKSFQYFGIATTPIRNQNGTMFDRWCMMVLGADDCAKLSEIRQGTTNDYRTIWSQGESIPAASQEMEAYYALQKNVEQVFLNASVTEDGKVLIRPGDEYYEMALTLEELRKTVPEWN